MTRFGTLAGLAALVVASALMPRMAVGMCDVIPGAKIEFRAALGTVDRPFTIPGDVGQDVRIVLDLTGCDGPGQGASPGFADAGGVPGAEDEYFVSIVFKPPSPGLLVKKMSSLEAPRHAAVTLLYPWRGPLNVAAQPALSGST